VSEEAPSHRATPVEAVVSKDQAPPERGIFRTMPFLPDPPLFDLTINRNQQHGLLHDEGAMSEVTRPDGASSLDFFSSACGLVPYL
jgi:hypothetical protein